MKIKIATWNTAYLHHKESNDDAWNFYLNETNADIFLFQEGNPTQAMTNQKNHWVWNEIGGKRNWGSGIYSPEYEILEEMVETRFKGVFSIGNTKINNEKITLISIYGLIESNGSTKGYSIPNLHRMISDLTGLFDGQIDGKRKIIMGGDLNASTQFDEEQDNHSHRILFDRIDDFGLKDVYQFFGNKAPIQTLRHAGSQKPWQHDYLFISKSLSKNLELPPVVLDNQEIRRLSDHNPVVIELEL